MQFWHHHLPNQWKLYKHQNDSISLLHIQAQVEGKLPEVDITRDDINVVSSVPVHLMANEHRCHCVNNSQLCLRCCTLSSVTEKRKLSLDLSTRNPQQHFESNFLCAICVPFKNQDKNDGCFNYACHYDPSIHHWLKRNETKWKKRCVANKVWNRVVQKWQCFELCSVNHSLQIAGSLEELRSIVSKNKL